MNIYVSGQIAGLDYRVAEEAFTDVVKRLKAAGHHVVSPMDLVIPDDKGYYWQQNIGTCIQAMLGCDMVFMLQNWQHGVESRIENYIATEGRMKIVFQGQGEAFQLFIKSM